MVGLVLVSHSRPLAQALKDMLVSLYGDGLPIAVAAGAGDEGNDLGTDATAIVAALEQVCGDDGAVVLLDLGSAILSAEFALDLVDEAIRSRTILCAGPLVEGAVAAGAQARIGATREAVRDEAQKGLLQKTTHLGVEAAPAPEAAKESMPSEKPDAQVVLKVENQHGLHARPAMRIVQTVGRFQSRVELRNVRTGGEFTSARSLVAINCLDARHGDSVEARAFGEDAEEALAALEALQAENFGDPRTSSEDAPAPAREAQPSRAGVVLGKPLSGGSAKGALIFASREQPRLSDEAGNPKLESSRLHHALASVRQQLDEQAAGANHAGDQEHVGIIEAHRLLLDDPALGERAEKSITERKLSAARAWQDAVAEVTKAYLALEDTTLRERAQDIEDLGLQVLAALGIDTAMKLSLPETGGILAVPALLPSDLAKLDLSRLRGVIAESIGPTSHAAILLRSAGIPSVDGVSAAQLRTAGAEVALDGDTGEVWLEAGDRAFEETVSESVSHPPLRTADGRRIELAANVASATDAAAGARAGAEAVGLLRTEFLFLDRPDAPDEDVQTDALRKILRELPGVLPITIRTLDIGGDKPAPYLPMPKEANPFLGVRGLRLALRRRDLFRTHLRAILRALEGRPGRIMFPMVTDPVEIDRARELLNEARAELVTAGTPHAWPVEVGMMIEVPAAALNVRAFAGKVDFFSIGTNDLTQYTLAAERGHPQLPEFGSALHPAVLRLVSLVASTARRHGKWAGVCGEAAGDPETAAVFVGLGITELSMGAASIAKVRASLSLATTTECRARARCIASAGAIREGRGQKKSAEVRRILQKSGARGGT